MTNNEKGLTPRQWATYNLIKENTKQGKWTTKQEIVRNYPFNCISCREGYIKNDTAHDLCSAIWSDINKINFSTEIDKLIISKGKNEYKLAETLEEAEDFKNDYYIKAIKALTRVSNINRKIRADGQGKLLSNKLEPIDEESKAREFIETYLKEDI